MKKLIVVLLFLSVFLAQSLPAQGNNTLFSERKTEIIRVLKGDNEKEIQSILMKMDEELSEYNNNNENHPYFDKDIEEALVSLLNRDVMTIYVADLFLWSKRPKGKEKIIICYDFKKRVYNDFVLLFGKGKSRLKVLEDINSRASTHSILNYANAGIYYKIPFEMKQIVKMTLFRGDNRSIRIALLIIQREKIKLDRKYYKKLIAEKYADIIRETLIGIREDGLIKEFKGELIYLAGHHDDYSIKNLALNEIVSLNDPGLISRIDGLDDMTEIYNKIGKLFRDKDIEILNEIIADDKFILLYFTCTACDLETQVFSLEETKDFFQGKSGGRGIEYISNMYSIFNVKDVIFKEEILRDSEGRELILNNNQNGGISYGWGLKEIAGFTKPEDQHALVLFPRFITKEDDINYVLYLGKIKGKWYLQGVYGQSPGG